MNEWDRRFLALAEHVSSWSKDPSTKVGAIIVDQNRHVVGLGYNGLPSGVVDTTRILENREMKYAMMVHAETNAIINAITSVRDCTIYIWPFMPCSRCAGVLINAGIARIVAPDVDSERWKESFDITRVMLDKAGVKLDLG